MQSSVDDAPFERPPVAEPQERRRERGADVHARHPADEHVLPRHGLASIKPWHRVLSDVEQPGDSPGEPESRDQPDLLDALEATSRASFCRESPRAEPAFDEAACRDDQRRVAEALVQFGILSGQSVKNACRSVLPRAPGFAHAGRHSNSERTATMTELARGRRSDGGDGCVDGRGRGANGRHGHERRRRASFQAGLVTPSIATSRKFVRRRPGSSRATPPKRPATSASPTASNINRRARWATTFRTTTLLDTTLDVEHPEVLVYEKKPDGTFKLNGVEFLVPISAWTSAEPPRIMGQALKKADRLGIWYLHVWTWKPSPSGSFCRLESAASSAEPARTNRHVSLRRRHDQDHSRHALRKRHSRVVLVTAK